MQRQYIDKYFYESANNVSFFFEGREFFSSEVATGMISSRFWNLALLRRSPFTSEIFLYLQIELMRFVFL